MTIDGCPADCADGKAESSLFNAGFEAAIGIQVGLAADNVEVTSVTVTKETGVVAGTPRCTFGLFFSLNILDNQSSFSHHPFYFRENYSSPPTIPPSTLNPP